MVTREIETERTVTETEKIDICDGCGKGEDAGTLRTYSPHNDAQMDDDKWDEAHFHSHCVHQLDTSPPDSDGWTATVPSGAVREYLTSYYHGILTVTKWLWIIIKSVTLFVTYPISFVTIEKKLENHSSTPHDDTVFAGIMWLIIFGAIVLPVLIP